MSQHRAEIAGRHRVVKPRYGRISVLVVSVLTTGVALLGGVGILPSATADATHDPRADSDVEPAAASFLEATTPSTEPETSPAPELSEAEVEPAVPVGSGEGRRVVFSQSQQRVWLVGGGEKVQRTYPVSGSAEDNLQPGTYQVYSKSKHAIGIDDSGTMDFFVRFTQGPSGAAIGFHDIPIDDGEMVQTLEQLGTPLSHGCIRQKRSDAKDLWKFAPIDTTVVVTA